MKKLNLEDLPEDSAHELLAVLESVSGPDPNTLLLKGDQAIYQISRLSAGQELSDDLAPHAEESFSETLDRLLDGPPLLEDEYMQGDEDALRRDAWDKRGAE